MIRYIIRPRSILTTPRLLKEALGAQRTLQYPIVSRVRRPDYSRDFFLCYPSIDELTNAFNSEIMVLYDSIRAFYVRNKPEQRAFLSSLGFPTPSTFQRGNVEGMEEGCVSTPRTFIARPLRHSGGREYRLLRSPICTTIGSNSSSESSGNQTEINPNSWDPTTEYLQELYPKDYEYRIIISRGTPLITLLKRVPESISNELPWNHQQGSTFITVTDWSNNRLRHTNVYDIIESNQDFFRGIDLCGLDILVNLRHPQPYVITELNLCPSLTIPDNLRKVAEHVSICHR